MRIRKKDSDVYEADLTPMIDMTFQLIAFFMVIINFAQTEQNAKIQLPESTLVKPPEQPFEHQLVIHLTREGRAIISGHEMAIDGLRSTLDKEAYTLELTQARVSSATVIIRAHRKAQAGEVQRLIKKCQESGFEKFALRAKGSTDP